MTCNTLNRAVKALIVSGHLTPESEHEALATLQKEFSDTIWKPWHIDDIHNLSMSLTTLEAQEVLQEVLQYHDPMVGITVYVLSDTAHKLSAKRPEEPYRWEELEKEESILELCPAIYSSTQPQVCARVIIYQDDQELEGFAVFYPDLSHGEILVDGFKQIDSQILAGKITRSVCSSIVDLIDRFTGLNGSKIERRQAPEINDGKEF